MGKGKHVPGKRDGMCTATDMGMSLRWYKVWWVRPLWGGSRRAFRDLLRIVGFSLGKQDLKDSQLHRLL